MTSFTQTLDTIESEGRLWHGMVQRDVQETELFRIQPSTIVLFQGEQCQARWIAIEDRLPSLTVEDSEGNFSTATYVFFWIGCVFLIAGLAAIIGGIFFASLWTVSVATGSLLISYFGFWRCVSNARNTPTAYTQERQTADTLVR